MTEICIKDNEMYCMCKDVVVGIIGKDDDEYYFKAIDNNLDVSDNPPIWDGWPNCDMSKPYNKHMLKIFIEEKVMPECRAKQLMDKLGINYYDPWYIIQFTRGITTDDYWWFAHEGDKYQELHIRAEGVKIREREHGEEIKVEFKDGERVY